MNAILPLERRAVIAQRLADGQTVSAALLAAEFAVSEDAVRRDLRALAAEGLCQRIYGSAGARFAFLSSARNIYLDNPYGRGGFYPRLSELSAPSLFVWGTHDTLIPHAFRRHVERWLPRAEQTVIENCGHVPQVERADEVNEMLFDFYAAADEQGERLAPLRTAA